MGIRVIKPGAYTSIQDTGRYGYQRYGVPVSGSMDRYAGAVANILCGNTWDSAVLEINFHGTKLFFDEDHLIAFTGGGSRACTENGELLPINRTIFVPQFSVIDTCYHAAASRLYMAIDGGVNVSKVMNSRSSYLPAGVDNQLKDKDIFKTLRSSEWAVKVMDQLRCRKINAAKWGPADSMIAYDNKVIRAMRGPEWDRFNMESQTVFFNSEYGISRTSDRMGYRLDMDQYASPLGLAEPRDMISTAVTKGTVQVVPQGSPLVLMSDAQTTGGYPRIAQVIAADLPLLAQKKPGDNIIFQEVSSEKAEDIYLAQIKDLLRLEKNLKAKFL
jgi:antagonist of KipI